MHLKYRETTNVGKLSIISKTKAGKCLKTVSVVAKDRSVMMQRILYIILYLIWYSWTYCAYKQIYRMKVSTQVLLTYQQFICRTIEMMFCLTKGGNLCYINVQHHILGQSNDLIFWVSLVTRTCNVWRNKLSRHFVGHLASFRVLSIC